MFGIVSQFLAQPADGDIHRPVERIAVDAAQGLKDFVPIHYPAGMPNQQIKGGKFVGGQVDTDPVKLGLLTVKIDVQPSKAPAAIRTGMLRSP